MSATLALEPPYILTSKARKHVTHNEALERLDALVQVAALGRAIIPPPLSVAA